MQTICKYAESTRDKLIDDVLTAAFRCVETDLRKTPSILTLNMTLGTLNPCTRATYVIVNITRREVG